MHVGLPCMKLSLSPSTQKHHDKKPGTCSVKAAWEEMNDLRKGRDETIDRSLTSQNVWLVGSSEMDMAAEIQKKIDLVNADKRSHGKRALRCDAVTGIEMIEKPPMEYMEHLSKGEQVQFLKGSGETMDQILKEWNPDWITIARVLHFDEFDGKSPHAHRIVVPLTKDKDGILSFNAKAEFNLKFFTFVNKEYPKRMRERGYDVEDCKIYEEMTPEEKEDHHLNKVEHGVEGFEFKRRKNTELDQQIAEKEALLSHKQKAVEKIEVKLANKEQEVADKEQEIAEKEKVLNDKTERLDDLDAEIRKKAEKGRELQEKNRETKIRILTKKQVIELPEPEKTIGGKYKVEPQTYRNLRATALRVDNVKDREKELAQKEQTLRKMKENIEKEKKLPVKEQLELFQLRKLKEVVVKLVDRLPEGLIKDVLMEALHGRDLLEKADRRIEQPHRVGNSEKEVI